MSIESYPSPNGVLTSLIWRKTMSGGETSLSGYDNASQALSYTPGQEQVYLNGILLVRGDDYTATNGTSITGLSALAASDFIQVNCYNNFSVATTPATSITGTIANNQLANSAITINGSAISLGGTVTLAGDIESVTATSPLTGGGSTGGLTIGIQESSTSQRGSVQLSDSTSTTSSVLAATPTAVKSAYDLANGAIPKTLTTTTGDIIYASGANTPARLGIGSTSQVLSVSGGVPVWSTPAVASSGLVYVTGATFSGVSSVDLPNNTFTTTYRNYQIYLDFSSGTGGSTFQIRVRKDGTTTSSGIYEYGNMNVNRGGSVTGVGGNGDTAWRLGYSNYYDRGANVITVYNPKASGQKITVTGSVGTGDGVNGQAGGFWQGSITGIDSLNFSISSGTMSGTYRVYGLADA